MYTWEEYKQRVKETDRAAGKDIEEMEMLASIVGAMVQQRNNLGLTQRELAALCDIPQSSVARIESCKSTPNLSTLLRILTHLDLQLTVGPKRPTI